MTREGFSAWGAGLGWAAGDPNAGQNEAAIPLAPGIPWISAEAFGNVASAVMSFSERSGCSHMAWISLLPLWQTPVLQNRWEINISAGHMFVFSWFVGFGWGFFLMRQ